MRLTNWPPKLISMMNNPPSHKTQKLNSLALWLWLAVGLITYLLPWVVNPGTGLTFGGYDLAEWTSLHPSVRAGGLTTTLLLRLSPVVLLVLFVLALRTQRFTAMWWAAFITITLGAIAMLPPLEFFTIFRDDPNYQQQMLLSVITLVGGFIAISGLLGHVSWYLVIVLGIIGIVVSGIGLTQSQRLMIDFSLPSQPGMGSFGMILTFLAAILTALFLLRRERKS